MTPMTIPATRERPAAYWRRIGLQLGSELGQIDRRDGTRRTPDQLRIPAGVPDAYVAALKEGYQAAVAGAPAPMGEI